MAQGLDASARMPPSPPAATHARARLDEALESVAHMESLMASLLARMRAAEVRTAALELRAQEADLYALTLEARLADAQRRLRDVEDAGRRRAVRARRRAAEEMLGNASTEDDAEKCSRARLGERHRARGVLVLRELR